MCIRATRAPTSPDKGYFHAHVLCLGVAILGCISAAAIAAPTSALHAYIGMCDASAAVSLDKDHFIVADDEANTLHIYAYSRQEEIASQQLSTFLETDPGKESDIEGAAAVGNRIYWISSHGRNSEGKKQSRRHRLFATTAQPGSPPSVTPVGQPYTRLQEDLVNDSSLGFLQLEAAAALGPEAPGGFNIEGLAATAKGELLIAFRSPLRDGKAILIPIENPAALVERRDDAAQFGKPLLLSLDGRGIRSIELVGGAYFIVAGPTNDTGSFAIYRWSGDSSSPPELMSGIDIDKLNPEALFAITGSSSTMALSDDGAVQTPTGERCKHRADRDKQTFRAYTFLP